MRNPEPIEEHRALVARLFATLTPILSFESVGDGWTCDTYRVNGDWIVQLPRSERAAKTLTTQMDVLPELAREVSAPVPVPELVSRDPAAMATAASTAELRPTRSESGPSGWAGSSTTFTWSGRSSWGCADAVPTISWSLPASWRT
jgi:hypothetical protein